MIKLDYPKWRAELDEAMQKKDAGKITRLHIIRAQIRGKQHRHRARLSWGTCERLKKLDRESAFQLALNGGTATVPLTYKDEAQLLGEAWKQYVVVVQPMRTQIPKEGFLAKLKRIFSGVYRV